MGVVGRLDQYASMLATEFDEYSMSENLISHSGIPFTSWATNSSAVVTYNSSSSPDGIINATQIAAAAIIGSGVYTFTPTLTSGTVYTYSLFVKAVSGSNTMYFGSDSGTVAQVQVNTSTGVASLNFGSPTNITSKSYPNGWYRISFTFTAGASLSHSFVIYNFTANANTWLAWGAQVERGSVATDYTPTIGATISRILPATTNTNITGLGTYYSSGFDENVGFATFLPANVFAPYDPVYDDVSGTLFGAGQGRYMRQNTDKSVIVYNEIDEVSDFRDIVRSGLLLDLDAGMNSSFNNTGTTWTDLSGNGRNGTINGSPTFTNGYFNITSDSTYISIPNSGLVPRTNDFTYSCWIYFNSVDSLDTIFENGSWSDSLILRYESTQFIVYAENAFIGAFSWTATTGVWVNIVLRRLSNTMSCFINNTSIGTPFAMSTDIDLANPNLWLMRSQHSTGQFTNGRIAVFSIYNRALSAAEILQNYNALRNRYGL